MCAVASSMRYPKRYVEIDILHYAEEWSIVSHGLLTTPRLQPKHPQVIMTAVTAKTAGVQRVVAIITYSV